MIDILPSKRRPAVNGAPRSETTPPIISAEHVKRVFSAYATETAAPTVAWQEA